VTGGSDRTADDGPEFGVHAPVLCDEALEALAVRPGGFYVDATFGRGGHAREIVTRLGPEGMLLALDRDPEAVSHGKALFASDPRVSILHAPFSELAARVAAVGRAVDGVLLDLGVSSPQLDQPGRGFSFQRDGALDMRMDPTRGASAAEWLTAVSERELADVIARFGEDRFARRIARAIVAARGVEPLATTGQLAAIVAGAVPTRESGKHPATRTFQAIRMRVNRELEELEAVLPQAVDVLAPRGRLAVISFHSLEDRAVKRFMRAQSQEDPAWAGLPLATVPPAARPRLARIGKAVFPGEAEIRRNPRARSAVLRVAERMAA
jgi:16S rRNA (cytosine1402-N4)-methyltransferase